MPRQRLDSPRARCRRRWLQSAACGSSSGQGARRRARCCARRYSQTAHQVRLGLHIEVPHTLAACCVSRACASRRDDPATQVWGMDLEWCLCLTEILQTPESRFAPGPSSVEPPLPADDQASEPTAAGSRKHQHGSDSAAGGHTRETPASADKPEAGSQAAASACTPQRKVGSAAGVVVTEAPTLAAPSCESSGRAAAIVCTPEHGPGAGNEVPAADTPTPPDAAPHAEGAAVASAETPVPGPSPQLAGQPDLITPPPQTLDDAETPGMDASDHTQQDTPEEALACVAEQQVHNPAAVV